jgi:hypothetical protein
MAVGGAAAPVGREPLLNGAKGELAVARLICIVLLLGWLAHDLMFGVVTLAWPDAMPFPGLTRLAILAFAAGDVAAIGLVAFSRGDRLPVFAQAMLLGPALLIAGCSLVAVVG